MQMIEHLTHGGGPAIPQRPQNLKFRLAQFVISLAHDQAPADFRPTTLVVEITYYIGRSVSIGKWKEFDDLAMCDRSIVTG